jgi:hypothetical protein
MYNEQTNAVCYTVLYLLLLHVSTLIRHPEEALIVITNLGNFFLELLQYNLFVIGKIVFDVLKFERSYITNV